MTVEVHVTEAIVEGVIAISHHLGHWAYGRYATGGAAANPLAEDKEQAAHADGDVDGTRVWWKTAGYRGNWMTPNAGDPIAGAWRAMDAVVKVTPG